jgi:hypothetical protein
MMIPIIKRISFFVLALMLAGVFISEQAVAKKRYVYRKRAEWVKFDKVSKGKLKKLGLTLDHPVNISANQMEAMLRSLTLTKGSNFKNELKEKNVFSMEEARKYAPLIVKALNQAESNEYVNVAIVHKRPYFIIRADYFSMISIYVTGNDIHFDFRKLWAKLHGDYEQASKLDAAINNAQSFHVNLELGPGQRRSLSNANEVIMDRTYDFWSQSVMGTTSEAPPAYYQPANSDGEMVQPVPTPAPVYRQAPAETHVKARLQQLEDLKKSGLITNKEYNEKRSQILSDL